MKAVLLSLVVALGTAASARAADVKVLTGGAFKSVVVAMAPAFERETGHRLIVENDTVGLLARRITAGEVFDVAVLTPALVDELAKAGPLDGGTRRDIARVGIGVAVRADAPSPDIATADAFRAALLAAPSVAFIDPKAGGSSGIYLAGLFARLGIADAIAAKAVLVPGGLVAERVVTGEAAIAVHQISEILPVSGARLVGPLPDAIQNYTTYTAAIAAGARDGGAARAFLGALAGPGTATILAGKGMQPAP